jgi:hypothetical protein
MGNGNSNMSWKFKPANEYLPAGSTGADGFGSAVEMISKLPTFKARSILYTHWLNALYNGNESMVKDAMRLADSFSHQVDDINESKAEIIKHSEPKVTGGAFESYYQKVNKELKTATTTKEATEEAVGKAKEASRKIFQKAETDPIFAPSNVMKVSNTDRVIFIAMTFAFRSITLFLIEWGIHNRMITKFENAFLMYFVIYLSLFFMWVVLVNVNPNDVLFHSMFYYVNVDVEKAYVRCAIHCAAQLLLLPLPFVLRDQQASKDALTFEERRSIISMLQRFTFFIWVLTSVIALRV